MPLAGLKIKPVPVAPPLHDVLVQGGNVLGRLDIDGAVFQVNGPSDLDDHGMLASGQFGRVHQVTHRESGTIMAVKRIADKMKPKDRGQCLMDLEVVRGADSPYVVQYYGVDAYGGELRIYMELAACSWHDVSQAVRAVENRIPEPVLQTLAASVTRGLAYLYHGMDKVMHRGGCRCCPACAVRCVFRSAAPAH